MFPALLLPDGRTIRFGARPLIMGILNVTPDSFSDGGLFDDARTAVDFGKFMAEEGADIIDIGGESTRPGHVALGADEESQRVLPVIAGLKSLAAPLSIDTYKAGIAETALKNGAMIVNDVWGAQRDPAIAGVAARAGAPMVLMHNRDAVDAGLDMIDEVRRFLERSIAIAVAAGVPRTQIVLDPGIGFGKTPEQNLLLIRHLAKLRELGPVLLGVSRKSTIGLVTGQKVPRDRLAGSIAANLYGVMAGADIIRVHDVRAHLDALKVWAAIGAFAMSMTSSILVDRLEIYAYHGCFEQEKHLGQRFTLDLDLQVDISKSAMSDNLEDTVHYGEVVAVATKAFTEKRFNLLEAAARAVAQAILTDYPSVNRVAVTLRKLSPPIPATLGAVGVSLEFGRDA